MESDDALTSKTWRSRQPSRLEGFSDAVFGFALTLLVVSVEVPRTFDELWVVVRGFLPFVFTFATIVWLWYEHYVFFRRFAPDDRVTILLNSALLFMVLFYVYPLKFLFTLVVNSFLGLPSFDRALQQPGDGVRLMVIYGVGYIVVFTMLALLYANVWWRRQTMKLDRLEAFDAWWGIVWFLGTASVGLLSVSIVVAGGDKAAPWAGMSYSLIGLVQGLLGFVQGSRRERLHREANLSV